MAKQTFGHVLEAAQQEPVVVHKHKHPTAVIVSVAEYDRLKLGQGLVPNQGQEQKNVICKAPVAKSLPSISKQEMQHQRCFTSEEMVALVKATELEANAQAS